MNKRSFLAITLLFATVQVYAAEVPVAPAPSANVRDVNIKIQESATGGITASIVPADQPAPVAPAPEIPNAPVQAPNAIPGASSTSTAAPVKETAENVSMFTAVQAGLGALVYSPITLADLISKEWTDKTAYELLVVSQKSLSDALSNASTTAVAIPGTVVSLVAGKKYTLATIGVLVLAGYGVYVLTKPKNQKSK